jgi:pyruvate/2-oxoglutarate/acetoin dehydrogenase E1 component
MRVVQSLNQALHDVMADDERVLFVGEDILDPYGGAFKVAAGLSTRFPERVITTPISEAGIVGLATGLTLRGYRPVVEIMFGDFLTLCTDQIVNHLAKFRWMYQLEEPLSLVIRTPMGGRRGYGPTHSQSLERLFLGVPGISVVAISPLGDPGQMLKTAVCESPEPVLFLENKASYAREVVPLRDDALNGWAVDSLPGLYPTTRIRTGNPADVTIATYGGMVPHVLEAAKRLLQDEELSCEILVYHQLWPADWAPLQESARRTGRAVLVEEGTGPWGWGAEAAAQLAGLGLEAPVQRVAADSMPIAASRALEDEILPQTHDIVTAVLRSVDEELAVKL